MFADVCGRLRGPSWYIRHVREAKLVVRDKAKQAVRWEAFVTSNIKNNSECVGHNKNMKNECMNK